MIRILLADDHAPIRLALVEVFNETEDITVVAECANGEEAVEAALRTRPDLVLMDVNMPGTGGLEATRRLLAAWPEARVVMLTASGSAASVSEARRLGAVGYLLKSDDPFDLPRRVREVAAGGTAWSPGAGTAADNAEPRSRPACAS
ncbi:MAG TPA: response regulator transcription factor [Geodermatophilus sp.]|nr:response regulator transcription factor [Geodermatophilus sp.]